MAGSMRGVCGAVPPLLAFILLFRLLIPAGYMIAPDSSGRPGLALCGAPAAAAADQRPEHHEGHGEAPAPARPGELPCPLAALSAPPLPPAPPVLLPPEPAAAAPPAAPARTGGVDSPALAAPPPPATGPPLPV